MREAAFRSLVAAVFLLLSAGGAGASVIYGDTTLVPYFGGGAPGSDANGIIDGQWQRIAGSFVLQPGASTITDIHWWGMYFFAPSIGGDGIAVDDFTVSIYADDGSWRPETLAALLDLHPTGVERTDTGASFDGMEIYSYTLDIAPLSLSSGLTYYLSVQNNTVGDPDAWAWSNTEEDKLWYQDSPAGNWYAYEFSGHVAFYLTDDAPIVPEPATLSLLGMGLAGVAVRWLRRRG